jgi:DNA-binding transcriptional MerR regulator
MTHRTYQVKDVSQIAGISIRALHHYDEIGLLVPKVRTEAGYRLYTDDDLLRLQQIVIGRELGLPLEFEVSKYEDEAKKRWGDTSAYQQATQRTKRYTADDWKNLRAEQAAIYADAVAVMRAGKEPHDGDALDVAERHLVSIDRWFYPCSSAMHRGLADMYASDSRFSENIDKHGEGLTAFLAAAIRANADRAEG